MTNSVEDIQLKVAWRSQTTIKKHSLKNKRLLPQLNQNTKAKNESHWKQKKKSNKHKKANTLSASKQRIIGQKRRWWRNENPKASDSFAYLQRSGRRIAEGEPRFTCRMECEKWRTEIWLIRMRIALGWSEWVKSESDLEWRRQSLVVRVFISYLILNLEEESDRQRAEDDGEGRIYKNVN